MYVCIKGWLAIFILARVAPKACLRVAEPTPYQTEVAREQNGVAKTTLKGQSVRVDNLGGYFKNN
jgi:hypothetical protein